MAGAGFEHACRKDTEEATIEIMAVEANGLNLQLGTKRAFRWLIEENE